MNIRARAATYFTVVSRKILPQSVSLWYGLLVAALAAFLGFKAWLSASYLPGQPIDGAFQLANALDRLHRGQLPGRDFLSFHGVGVLLIHYPLYVLLGATAFASEVARQLVSPLVTTTVIVVLARHLSGSSKMAGLTGIVYLAATFLSDTRFMHWLLAPQPGNSLIALRWAYPAACALVVAKVFQPVVVSLPRALLAGSLLGLAPWWSYEQGVYAVAAAVLTVICCTLTRRDKLRHLVPAVLGFVVAIGAVGWLALALSSGGHAGELLQYVFRDIPANQGWYFGAPPNKSLAVDGFTGEIFVYLVVVTLLVLATTSPARKALQLQPQSTWVVTYLTWYAVLAGSSLAGYLLLQYSTPGVNALFLILACAVFRLTAKRSVWQRRATALSLGFVTAATVALCWSGIQKAQTVVRGSEEDSETVSGMHLVERYASLRPFIATVASAPDPRVFSTYRGLLEYAQDQPPQGRADYIIHALRSEEWRHWMDTFEAGRFPFAHTIKPGYSKFEEWLQASHWEFYEGLVQNYAIVGQSEFGLLWQRRAAAEPLQRLVCRALPVTGDGRFELARMPTVDFYEITVRYRVRDPLRVIPLLGALPRYLVEHTGLKNTLPLSLDPNADAARWLVAPSADVSYLRVQSYAPLGSSQLEVVTVTACGIPIPGDVLPAFSYLTSTHRQLRDHALNPGHSGISKR